MQFASIPGHEQLKEKLIQLVQEEQIPHALLFKGNEGYGHLPLALAFQTYMSCENKGNHDSCGTCAPCQQSNKLVHPDHHYIFPVSNLKKAGSKPSSNAYIKEWREFILQNPFGRATDWVNFAGFENKQLNIAREESFHIIRDLSLKSFSGKYKTMCIWLPEFMHPATANGILKILEEPPEGTIFILVSNKPEQLLNTILSRTQSVQVGGFRPEDIQEYLSSNMELNPEACQQAAQLAEGSLLKAIDLAGQQEDDLHEVFRDWMLLCLKHNLTKLTDWCEKYARMNKSDQKSLLSYGLAVFRESIIAHHKMEELHHFPANKLEFIRNFSKKARLAFIETAMKNFNDTLYYLERNANPKISMMHLSLVVAMLFKRFSS